MPSSSSSVSSLKKSTTKRKCCSSSSSSSAKKRRETPSSDELLVELIFSNVVASLAEMIAKEGRELVFAMRELERLCPPLPLLQKHGIKELVGKHCHEPALYIDFFVRIDKMEKENQ